MAPILETGSVIKRQYEVSEQLNHYKELFVVKDRQNSNQELILKVEIIDENETNRLQMEWNLYQRLSTTKCFDFVVDFFSDNRFRYLLMKPLGQNLYEFWKQKSKQNEWNLESVVRFADQMISRVANCHLRGIIHRDIKPENFIVDTNDNNYLYLIDFNLGKQFSSPNEPHIPYRIRSPNHSVGNVQFLSVYAHKGVEQSRRDDLISVCYTLIYLAKGSLPWSKLRSKDFKSRAQYLSAVADIKLKCSVDELCNGLPLQFKQLMNYCLCLEFEESPNYIELRDIISHLLTQLKSSNVTLVPYLNPNIETDSTVKKVPPKSEQKFSERFKKCCRFSPPMKCP